MCLYIVPLERVYQSLHKLADTPFHVWCGYKKGVYDLMIIVDTVMTKNRVIVCCLFGCGVSLYSALN